MTYGEKFSTHFNTPERRRSYFQRRVGLENDHGWRLDTLRVFSSNLFIVPVPPGGEI